MPRDAATALRRLSLSEIEALCLKAARGAGLPWGLAEEAGMAARWLAAAGQPGPDWLQGYFAGPLGLRPDETGADWRASGALCPIATGAALSDHAAVLPGQVTVHDVLWPGLMLPFVASLAGEGAAVSVSWEDGAAIVAPGGARLDGLPPVRATITLGRTDDGIVAAPAQGCDVAERVWKPLNKLALATTVPASAASRAGAGAGSVDND